MSLPPFEQVVDEHGEVVLRVCRGLAGPGDAEEVWSETFLAALAAYPRLRPQSNIRGWLLTIARNKAIDLARAGAREPVPVESVPETPVPEARRREADAPVWAALAALPAKQRGAVAYHYLADLPYTEVGRLLDTSEAAARRSAADGLASLRKTLAEEDRR